MFSNPGNAPLQLIEDEELEGFDVKLYIKREDLIHPFISGNKWRKLKYNFVEAKKSGFEKIITFGGAYSNHISAVAAAGKEFGFETIGIIRGEENAPLNPTLSFAQENGMQFIYLSREKYREGISDELEKNLKKEFGRYYLIPEGGTNALAVLGASEIIEEIEIPFDYICSPVGTGGTLAGLITADRSAFEALGFSALKQSDYIKDIIKDLVKDKQREWKILDEYAFGGYAKFNDHLIDFINQFKKNQEIQLDPIYTGKMMFGIYDLIKKDYFIKGTTIIAIHTGGLQGIDGFNKRSGNIINH